MHKLFKHAGGRHTPSAEHNKPLPEPVVDPDEGKTPIGELVIIPIQGRDLPNRERFGKQDPFILFKLGNVSKRSSTDVRGGQRPRWNDEQINILMYQSDAKDATSLYVSCMDEDHQKNDLIGDCVINLAKVLERGEHDDWFELKYRGREAGELMLQLTYYSRDPQHPTNRLNRPGSELPIKRPIHPTSAKPAKVEPQYATSDPKPAVTSAEDGAVYKPPVVVSEPYAPHPYQAQAGYPYATVTQGSIPVAGRPVSPAGRPFSPAGRPVSPAGHYVGHHTPHITPNNSYAQQHQEQPYPNNGYPAYPPIASQGAYADPSKRLSGQGYPPASYPTNQGYPPQGGYPPQISGGYSPFNSGGYPPQNQGGYPPQNQGGYPPQNQGGYLPQNQGGYQPQNQGGYQPQNQGGYPPQNQGYPPQNNGGYPPQGGPPPGYPFAASNVYPPSSNSGSGYPQQQQQQQPRPPQDTGSALNTLPGAYPESNPHGNRGSELSGHKQSVNHGETFSNNQEPARDRSEQSRRREGLIRHDDNTRSKQAYTRIKTRTRSQSGSERSSPTDERVSSRAATSPTSVLASMPPPPPSLSDAAASLLLLEPAEEKKTESDVELEEVVRVKLGSDPVSEPVPVPAPSAQGAGSPESLTPVDRQQKKRDSQDQHDLQKAKEDAKIEALKATILELQTEEQALIKKLRGEGSAKEIIDRHIQKLHEYNEIKDVGQCAELEGTTIRKQYESYGLDPTD
ncbi:hypothetical protein BGZ92_009528 [Podila epicladia]|nr:hypothetical protein BGZ92_009528 [Podila epicladia]